MSRIALTAIGVICAMATWIYTVTDTYTYNHYQLFGNALNVKDYLEAQGFAAGAVVGIIANMEHESYLNPGQCEIGYNYSTSRGYGLVQWTPGTKIINYASSVGSDWYDGDTQMDFLMINAPASCVVMESSVRPVDCSSRSKQNWQKMPTEQPRQMRV